MLRSLLERYGRVDWVDVDIQGAEECLPDVAGAGSFSPGYGVGRLG